MDQQNLPTKKSSYAKRPIWQWLLIYAVVGGAIYAAIYAFAYKPAHGYSYGSKTNTRVTQPAPQSPPVVQANTTPASSSPATSQMPTQSAAGTGGSQW